MIRTIHAIIYSVWPRRILTGLLLLTGPLLIASLPLRRPVPLAIATALLLILFMFFTLPRLAFSALFAGRYASARRRYQWQAASLWPPRRVRGQLGCLAALVGLERWSAARDALRELDQGLTAVDDEDIKVVRDNLEALLALGEGQPAAALTAADRATEMRPEIAALQHTRARALLALDRVDEALTLLELAHHPAAGAQHELARCQTLADAWRRKGQDAYAATYQARAAMLENN